MEKFQVKDITPDRFVTKARRLFAKGPLGKIVSGRMKGEQIEIKFSQLGTSVMLYNVEGIDDGFRATKARENIAFTHGMLRKEVEKELRSVFERMGVEFL